MVESEAPDIGPQQIDAVLQFLPIFEEEDFSPGEWQRRDGFYPHFAYQPEVIGFIRALYEQGFVLSFDWLAWKEAAQRYQSHPQELGSADLPTICKLLTAHVRADRFTEGYLASLFESRHLQAILGRLRELREEGDGGTGEEGTGRQGDKGTGGRGDKGTGGVVWEAD